MSEIYKDLQQKLEDAKKDVLREALLRSSLNVSKAAIGLSISRGTVNKYVRDFWGKNYRQVLLTEATYC